MITTTIAYGILLTNEFGRAYPTTKSIVDLVNKHAIAAGVAAGDRDEENGKPQYDDYEKLPWLVTEWSVEKMQLLVGVEAIMEEANTPQLHEEWLAMYETVPEDVRQAIAAAGYGNPGMEVLSGKI